MNSERLIQNLVQMKTILVTHRRASYFRVRGLFYSFQLRYLKKNLELHHLSFKTSQNHYRPIRENYIPKIHADNVT